MNNHFLYDNQRYYLLDTTGKIVAEITYTVINDGRTLSIDHTIVDQSLRGHGIAKQLVDLVVNEAKANQQTVKPVCSYARKLFFKLPEYQEITYHESNTK